MSVSPAAGPSTPARSSSGIIYRSMSVVDSRARTPGPLLSSLSRSSTPAYLPPRYRSASVFTSEAAERANDIDRQRRQAAQRCMSTWEALMEKYGAIGVEDDDEVDIITGKIVVNRGRVEKMQEVDIGGILGSPEEESDDDDGATEGDADPDRDELAGWSDEEAQRDAAHVLAHRPWTHEDDADLAAFKRAETERRALNDEDELDVAPPVALLFPSKDEALPRRMREQSVAHWKHGTRVYESSEDLHRRSAASRRHEEGAGDSDNASADGSISESSSIDQSPVAPTAEPRYPTAPSRVTINRSRSVPSFTHKQARSRTFVAPTPSPSATLADLFTPTPSPPPSRSRVADSRQLTEATRPAALGESRGTAPSGVIKRRPGPSTSPNRRLSDANCRSPELPVVPATLSSRATTSPMQATQARNYTKASWNSNAQGPRQLHTVTSAGLRPARASHSKDVDDDAPHDDFAGDAVDFFTHLPAVPTKQKCSVNSAQADQRRIPMSRSLGSIRNRDQVFQEPDTDVKDPIPSALPATATLPCAPVTLTPVVRRKYTPRGTRPSEPVLPIPAPEDVGPPNDPDRYFTHLHRLNPNTVRSCRLCRIAQDAQRRANSYYCKGRQNAEWCLLAKEAGEEVTPVRDRNKALKERKRAMTEARQSMEPGSEERARAATSAREADGVASGGGSGGEKLARTVSEARRMLIPASDSEEDISEKALPARKQTVPTVQTLAESVKHWGKSGGAGRRGRHSRAMQDSPTPEDGDHPSDAHLSQSDTPPPRAKSGRPRTAPATTARSASGSSRSAKAPGKDVPLTPGKRKRGDSARLLQYRGEAEDDTDFISTSPSPGPTLSLPPSSPVDMFSPSRPNMSRMTLPTPSPTVSAEKQRATPASSPLASRTAHDTRPFNLPTPPLSSGNRSASLASEEYTLPKTIPRPRLRSILRHSSSTPYLSDYAESDNGRSGSTKRARFSLIARSPTHDDVSYDEGDLVYPSDDCGSSPIKQWRGRSSESIEDIPRELAVRAADAGVHLTGHTGRLPSHLLRVLAPHLGIYPPLSPDAGPSRLSASQPKKAIKSYTESPGLMLPPPLPSRRTPATPTRPSPLVKTNSAPAAIRRQRSKPPPVEEISTPIIFRKALPLHVRASIARSQSRSRSRSVSIAPIRIKTLASSDSDDANPHPRRRSTTESEGKKVVRSQSARTILRHWDDLGPDWGLDEDIL